MTQPVRARNDGEDFHLLWTARRAPRLLVKRTGLAAIQIEGCSPAELVIDTAEYYGDRDFSRATRIELATQACEGDSMIDNGAIAASPRRGCVMNSLSELVVSVSIDGLPSATPLNYHEPNNARHASQRCAPWRASFFCGPFAIRN